MKTYRLLALVATIVILSATAITAGERYVGGDISLLPKYVNAGARYLTHTGTAIDDPLRFFADEGMNCMRVRLFVNPADYYGKEPDANACQDLEYIKPLCKQIKDAGHALMLDFHYSDYWADPSHQWTPKAWESLTDEQLYDKIYEYTHDVLTQLVEYGAAPDLIQPGNEISYGMLWGPADTPENRQLRVYSNSDANWDRFFNLLRRAISACREVCPKARILLHNERIARQSVMLDFFTRMQKAGIDYDEIALSYYPYYHGGIATLENAIKALESAFPTKPIQIVEFGYPYAWEIKGNYDLSATYPYTDEGQRRLTADLITMLNRHDSVTGLSWWWMEYNAYWTSLTGWYNAPLFDSRTGRATSALSEMKNFKGSDGVTAITADDKTTADPHYYDLSGRAFHARPSAPGIYLHHGAKVIVN